MAELLDDGPSPIDATSVSEPSQVLPALPIPGGVVLPGMVITIALETPVARAAADAADRGDGRLLLIPLHTDGRYATVAALATIESRGTLPAGTPALVVRATGRARVGAGVIGTTEALHLTVEPVDDPAPTGDHVELGRELRAALSVLLEQRGGRRLGGALDDAAEPGALADLAGWWPELTFDRKVELLEAVDVGDRVRLVLGWTKAALAEAELADRIRSEVSDGLDKSQREFLLRQQLAAIRKELGDDGADDDPVAEFRSRLDDLVASGAVGDAVSKAIEREIGRLERTSAQNAEHGWIRTWLETVLELPWGVTTPEHLDVADASRILDEDHNGLDEVKERIVELLAVRKLRSERVAETEDDDGDGSPQADVDAGPAGRRSGTILALVGPPGVGKTSLGESVARALNRRFVRVALGGVRDEAEVRGHRRTYVGAQPGRIARALQEAGSMNPVFLLDEVDKVGADWRGDPSSALLEVLDPAQNHSFRDHYLEVDLDLSDVLFIATANTLDTIPGPLLDRMEVVPIDGYTAAEKVGIARDHLLARQLRANGLDAADVDVTDAALLALVERHTREAGVRSLDRMIGKLLRKLATRVAAGNAQVPIEVTEEDLVTYLGRPRFHDEVKARTAVPGVATGLAVTGAGGDVLFVEVTVMDGEAGLTVTGQLGDVMVESAKIALSHVRSRATTFGIDPNVFDRHHIHVHFPSGAVPKDGPSAGVTMTTALVSALTDRPVRNDLAMTGEVTLQGRVLPIGGVKQKVLAANRAGMAEVILPKANEPDVDDVPEAIRADIVISFADDVAQVVGSALLPPERGAEPSLERTAA